MGANWNPRQICYFCSDLLFLHKSTQMICYSCTNLLFTVRTSSCQVVKHKGGQVADQRRDHLHIYFPLFYSFQTLHGLYSGWILGHHCLGCTSSALLVQLHWCQVVNQKGGQVADQRRDHLCNFWDFTTFPSHFSFQLLKRATPHDDTVWSLLWLDGNGTISTLLKLIPDSKKTVYARWWHSVVSALAG